ncbi:glutamate-rich protein 3 isoform X2 [Xenopus laevis]|uniref:Glutamate-rich protein 3 isoform X2 n=2 Tax=Xenopus laevis TaxID=8355 RepID=A0A1L8GLQ3_XENLA|nr:glutamate-rich protein 3 isoform X2 [Xenopus laevis]OCT84782.1 hypothetical protein XELAEV_18022939mg [Xenopus laevis]
MSHPYVGPLSAYNSLTDKHLTGYFNNTRIRRHLQRAGLITRSGRILTEKEYKINSMRRDHQKYIRQCLAQAIFQKVIDMERHHQIEIKRKLETFARRERIQRIKADQSKTVEEETFALFSPRPPTGPKSGVTRPMIIQRELSDSSESVSSPRPNTAPGNMQRPVRLQPIQAYCPSRNAPKTSSGSRQKESADEQEQQFPRGVDRDLMKLMNAMDHSVGVSPYRLPIINNFVMPAPPPQRKYPKQLKHTMSTSSRGRRFRPTTAPIELELTSKDSGKFHKTVLHSNVAVTMVYLGKNVHLSHDDNDFRDEIKVFQQHCGGENLCVFKGRLQEGETFNLISRRHRGFPFSLTFYINCIQVDRLSSCCEYKHRKGARLGGKNGYFGFVNIEGASPCYRCIIAMGLDKKPSPPPKKAKDEEYDSNEEKDSEDFKHESLMDKEAINDTERDEEHEEGDVTIKKVIEETSSAYDKTDMEYEEDEEEEDEEYEGGKKEDKNDEYEADDEAKDEYDEDFEVEEEKPDEKTNEEGQVDDQVNGKSKSPSDDEKDDLDHEGESNKPSKEATETSDSEKDERDGHSDSEYEEDKQERKHSTGSVSSHSTILTSSSEAGSSDEENEGEAKTSSTEHPKEHKKQTLENSENIQDSVAHLGDETHSEGLANEEPKLEETGETDETETFRKEEITLTEDNVEEPQSLSDEDDIEHGVSPSENVFEQEAEYKATVHMDKRASMSQDNLIDDNKHSETEEEGDGRSVQEKIADAIDECFNSEPEPSDSSTDEEDNFKNAFHGSKSSGQTSLNETDEIIEHCMKDQNNAERSTSRADSMKLETASEFFNLPDRSIDEELKSPFNDLETGSQNIDEHMQDEDATAGEKLKQLEDAVEESKQPDELIDNGENINDTISVDVSTDCEKTELESLHKELTKNGKDIEEIEAPLETPEIERDKETQNNSDNCDTNRAPDAAEMEEDALETSNINADTEFLDESTITEEQKPDDEDVEEQNILVTEKSLLSSLESGDTMEDEVQESIEKKEEEIPLEDGITLNEDNSDLKDHDVSVQSSATLNMENDGTLFSNDTKGEEGEDHIEEHEKRGILTTEQENIAVISDSFDEVEETENKVVQETEQNASENEIAPDSATHDELSEENVDKKQTEDGIQGIAGTETELPDANENITEQEQNENNTEGTDTSYNAGNEVDSYTGMENVTSSVIEKGELIETSDIVKAENNVNSEDIGEENASIAVSPETNEECIAIEDTKEEQTPEESSKNNVVPSDQNQDVPKPHDSTECIAIEDDNSKEEQTIEESSESKYLSEYQTKECIEPVDSEVEWHAEISDAGNKVDSCTEMENVTSSVMLEEGDALELVDNSDTVNTGNEINSEDISAETASRAVSPEKNEECKAIEDTNEEQTTEKISENNIVPTDQDDGNQDVSDISRDDANSKEEHTTEEISENIGLHSDHDDCNQDVSDVIYEKEVESVSKERQLQSQDVAVEDDMANVMESFPDETTIECDNTCNNNVVEHSAPITEEHSSDDLSKEMVSAPEVPSLETQGESSDVNDASVDMSSKTENESDNVDSFKVEHNMLDEEEGTDSNDNADQIGQEENFTSDILNEGLDNNMPENEHTHHGIVNESTFENKDTLAEMCSNKQDTVNNIASSDQDKENSVEQSTETKGKSNSVNEETETVYADSTDPNDVSEKQKEEMEAENTTENVSINSLHETDDQSSNTNKENREQDEKADSKEDNVSQIVDEEEINNIGPLKSEISQSKIADNEKTDTEQEEYVQQVTPATEFSESSENIEESLNKTMREKEGEVNETDQDMRLNESENTPPHDQIAEVLNVSAAGEEEFGTVNSTADNEVSQAENKDPI